MVVRGKRAVTAVARRDRGLVPRADGHRAIREPRVRRVLVGCVHARAVDRWRRRLGRIHGVHLDNLSAVLARGTADWRPAAEQVVQADRGARG